MISSKRDLGFEKLRRLRILGLVVLSSWSACFGLVLVFGGSMVKTTRSLFLLFSTSMALLCSGSKTDQDSKSVCMYISSMYVFIVVGRVMSVKL